MNAPRRIMALCGGSDHEMFLVRPHDRLTVTGANAGEVGLRSNFRTRVRTEEDAMTQCFRGKYIHRGQDVHLSLDADGSVTQVTVRPWCPVPPEVQRCVDRVVRRIDFADLGPTAGDASFSFDLVGM